MSIETENRIEHVPTETPVVVESKNAFTSSKGNFEVNEQKYIVRVLKMLGSTLLFICDARNERLDEMAVAINLESTKQVIGTTIIGPTAQSESQRVSEQLCRRFKRQFIVSYNVQVDAISAPLFERALGDFIRTNSSYFA